MSSTNDVDLSEADRNLRQTISELEELAESYDDARARNTLEDLRDDLERVRRETAHTEQNYDELRSATYNAFNQLENDLEAVISHLDRYENIEIRYDNLIEGDIVINEGTTRRGLLKGALIGGTGVGALWGTAWFADNYDLRLTSPFNSQEDGDQEDATNLEDDSEQNTILDRTLDDGEYDLVVFDNDIIQDIGDDYRGYSGEIGDLGTEIRNAYRDSLNEDLTLGYHNNTQHVQLKNLANERLVNFGLENRENYETAKDKAEWVN